MINKKLLAAVSIAATIATSSAFAKTEGSYVGVDLLATEYKLINTDGSRTNNTSYGIGANYKYAFNFDKIFVAPGVFYNHNRAEIKNLQGGRGQLKYSYGAKADLGYDITDKFAPFVTLGYQESRHTFSGVDNATEESIVYGVGGKYSVTNDVDVALAYEYSNYVKSGVPNSVNPEVIKLGVAYKF
jgi:opacity protein-like surface antigen